MASEKHFAVNLKRSGASRPTDQRKTLKGLGLNRFGKTIYLKDTPAIRVMLYKVVHLVDVEPKNGPCRRHPLVLGPGVGSLPL